MTKWGEEMIVVKLLKEHYKGGSVLDIGCGYGRYKTYFEDWHGIDKKTEVGEIADIKTYKPKKVYDYVFSSVTLEQLDKIPDIRKWGKKMILVEPTELNGHTVGVNLKHDYIKLFKPDVVITMSNKATFMVVEEA